MQHAMDATTPTHPNAPWTQGLLVVDDHELLRLGLRTLVQSQALANGQAVQVFEAHNLEEALAVFGEHADAIQLVLLDLHLPDAHGLSGLRTFLSRFPSAHVVVLSGTSDPALQRDALAMGAAAYLTKSGNLNQVVGYIAGLNLLGPSNDSPKGTRSDGAQGNASMPVGRTVRASNGESVQMTARQAQVLDWILLGWSNRQIADHANLSEGTVKNHVSTLLLLLGARSRAQLISQLR